jgi:hypothetical protein
MEPEPQGREGRARSGRGPLLAATMVALLAGVWIIGGRLSGEPTTPSPVPETIVSVSLEPVVPEPPPLTGRLVYPTADAQGPTERPHRLWVLDLATGAISPGPRVPEVEELVAVGPDRSWILVTTDLGVRGGAAYLVRDLSPDGVPLEVASGARLAVSNGADAVVAARAEPPLGGCARSSHALLWVALARGAEREVVRGHVCGRVLSVAAAGDQAYASTIRDRVPQIVSVDEGPVAFYPGSALVSVGPDGSWLTVEGEAGGLRPLRVWPRTPTGMLTWSRGPSNRRPLVPGTRLLVERVVAWSSGGRAVVVNGIVEGRRSMWLVDIAEGSMSRLLPAGSVPPRSASSGAAFDAYGTVFVGRPGEILVGTREGLESLVLPPDAPTPSGPVAWLP